MNRLILPTIDSSRHLLHHGFGDILDLLHRGSGDILDLLHRGSGDILELLRHGPGNNPDGLSVEGLQVSDRGPSQDGDTGESKDQQDGPYSPDPSAAGP
ncbi:MAG: hypothetical protein E5V60_00835 [Mesorhizobium sp.]|nr:MAG: hypothetical protein E5W25_02145 [Mesorhizobium sp.]TIW69401.1 MAG: hypothetical protein E5V60_00835 [Mesorhizobium sp.]